MTGRPPNQSTPDVGSDTIVTLNGSSTRSSAKVEVNVDGLKNNVTSSVPATANVPSVGRARSIVISGDAIASVAGPRLPAKSKASVAKKRGRTVPVPQPVTVTVRVAPTSEPGPKMQPVALPVLEKSPGTTPVTDSENVRVYVSVVAAETTVASVVKLSTVGGTRSRVICASAVSGAGSTLPAWSEARVYM